MGERMSETEHEAPVEVDEPVPYVDEDPFAAWPQPESGEVIEDPPEEGESVEHVEGEIEVPDGYEVIEGNPSGRKRQVAVVVSRFNGGLTNRMLARALEALEEGEGASDAITIVPGPGAVELPLAAVAPARAPGGAGGGGGARAPLHRGAGRGWCRPAAGGGAAREAPPLRLRRRPRRDRAWRDCPLRLHRERGGVGPPARRDRNGSAGL